MLKPGEFYSICSLAFTSEGLKVSHDKIHRRAKEDDFVAMDIEYLHVRQYGEMLVPLSQIGSFWFNAEARNPRNACWYMIYPAMMQESELEKLIKAETERILKWHIEKYERLLSTTNAMLVNLQGEHVEQTNGGGFIVTAEEKS